MMNCVLCGTQTDGARSLHGKAICAACFGTLSEGSVGAAPTAGRKSGSAKSKGKSEAMREKARKPSRGAQVLSALSGELARLNVAEEDVGPSDCIIAKKHGTLFQLSDDTMSVVAPGEKLLDRLRGLPDGAGLHATWWMLADL